MEEKKIIQKHDEILDHLLKYKEKNNDFTFLTRVSNRHNRLDEGFWFQGNEKYMFIPLYKVGSGTNKTKTIGFVYTKKQSCIEVLMHGINDLLPEERIFYEDIIKFLRNNNDLTEKQHREDHYDFCFSERNLIENIDYYIDTFRVECNRLLDKYSLKEKYILDEKKFKKNMAKIASIKEKQNSLSKLSDEEKDKLQELFTKGENNMNKQPLNQILYGPPGTGKTYNTINKALEIMFNIDQNGKTENEIETELVEQAETVIKDKELKLDETKEDQDREKLKVCFDYFSNEGQIEFVTFHQSYGYEEFIEGIKPEPTEDEKNIKYEVKPGTFKRLCESAKTILTEITTKYDFNENINIWKISLGDTQNSEDDLIFNYCVKNNKILLGFGSGLDFSECKTRGEISSKLDDTQKYSYPPTAIDTLKNKIKVNDIVLVSYGNRKLRAIGRVTGEYELLEDDELNTYVQSRNVEWLLVPEEPFSYEKVLKKQFSQMSIYNITNNTKIDDLRELLAIDNGLIDKRYVLIIDEINRGNISKIFGELITLIEPSKRIGAEEELRVKLPYSGDIEEPFGVPSNLYILGTMNTADRSIALMDTALRRRFDFEEMMPKPNLLPNKIVIDDTDVKIQDMLTTMNNRIEYLYDRDHTVGHSYFMSLDGAEDKKAELSNIFRNKIIPLLQEYFYDDWEKIQMVLGDHISQFDKSKREETEKKYYIETDKNECINKYRFIESITLKEEDIFLFDHDDIDDSQIGYKVSEKFDVLSYQKIYDDKNRSVYKTIESYIKPKIQADESTGDKVQ